MTVTKYDNRARPLKKITKKIIALSDTINKSVLVSHCRHATRVQISRNKSQACPGFHKGDVVK